MEKRNKIIYWIATIWLALGMTSTGIVQLIKMKEEADMFSRLGYPVYLLTILGVWKLLGVIAVLIPKFPLVKEWAYAGFFFAMSGAIFSHIAVGDEAKELFGPSLLIVLTVVSWYFRPEPRRPEPRRPEPRRPEPRRTAGRRLMDHKPADQNIVSIHA